MTNTNHYLSLFHRPQSNIPTLFESLFNAPPSLWGHNRASSLFSDAFIDAAETDDGTGYEFSIPLPGYSKEDVTVEVTHDGVLSVNAVRKQGAETKRRAASAAVNRSITLPIDADGNSAAAKLEHGILIVTFKKSLTAAPKRVIVA